MPARIVTWWVSWLQLSENGRPANGATSSKTTVASNKPSRRRNCFVVGKLWRELIANWRPGYSESFALDRCVPVANLRATATSAPTAIV
jgi:hypothetical protein